MVLGSVCSSKDSRFCKVSMSFAVAMIEVFLQYKQSLGSIFGRVMEMEWELVFEVFVKMSR